MIIFEPLGGKIRIVVPDAVGAVVHGRVRLFLSDNADAYPATAGEGSWPGITEKSEPVTIYHAIGLGSLMLDELAGMILANSQPAALYVVFPTARPGSSPGAADGSPCSPGELGLTASRARAAPPRSSALVPTAGSRRA